MFYIHFAKILNRVRLFSLLGSALDLNFSDINVASLDKELEDQDNNGLGLTSKT